MSDKNSIEQRAIFLAAVCGQTYTQFANTDGSFVVPTNYTVRYTIRAKSFSHVWERFGFILESPKEIIIAFRGTSTTTDWVSDIIASQQSFKYMKEEGLTHRGFTQIYSSARQGILSELSKLSQDKILYVTGHSLGGALATLSAVDIAANSAYSPVLFTFGSPRVGDPDFVNAFAKYVPRSYRIANLFDIVTHAPPPIYKLPKRDKKFYYSHVRMPSKLSFQKGAIGLNHVIASYFAELASLHPEFTSELCSKNPGFCPETELTMQEPNATN